MRAIAAFQNRGVRASQSLHDQDGDRKSERNRTVAFYRARAGWMSRRSKRAAPGSFQPLPLS